MKDISKDISCAVCAYWRDRIEEINRASKASAHVVGDLKVIEDSYRAHLEYAHGVKAQ